MTRTIRWGFMERDVDVLSLGEDAPVAYSWTCGEEHSHTIECLWVWHDCDQSADPVNVHGRGWKPAGVGAHDLIAADPLHIEASVYWPSCCGLHGFIRDGRWIGV